MTYEEEKEKTIAVAQKIADAMGWQVKKGDSWQVEITNGDLSLNVQLSVSGDRIKIYGIFRGLSQYLYRFRNPEKTEITVGANKPVERIVKDIQSRLLPAYQIQLAEARAQKQKNDEYQEKKKRTIEELATHIHDARMPEGLDSVYGYEPNLTLKWSGDNSFRLEIDLTTAQVKKVLAVVYEEAKP